MTQIIAQNKDLGKQGQNKTDEVKRDSYITDIEFQFDEIQEEISEKQGKQNQKQQEVGNIQPVSSDKDNEQIQEKQGENQSNDVTQKNDNRQLTPNNQTLGKQDKNQPQQSPLNPEFNQQQNEKQPQINPAKNLSVSIRKGSIRKNKPAKKTIEQIDLSTLQQSMQLSYRMTMMRKKKQLQFYKKISQSIELSKTPIRKIGGILHIKRNTPDNHSPFPKSNQIQRQKLILERSKKATELYQFKKYLHSLIFEIADEAVERIQQKRTFFSYKFHSILNKKAPIPKLADFINLSNSTVTVSSSNRIKLESLEGVTINNSRVRNMGLSRIQSIRIQKEDTQSSQEQQSGDSSQQEKSSQSNQNDDENESSKSDSSDNKDEKSSQSKQSQQSEKSELENSQNSNEPEQQKQNKIDIKTDTKKKKQAQKIKPGKKEKQRYSSLV